MKRRKRDCRRVGIGDMIVGMILRLIVIVVCFAAAAGVAGGQRNGYRMLIEYKEGTLDDLKGMRRFYVIAPYPGERTIIEKRINGRHGLRAVRGGSRQFHIHYGCSRWAGAAPEDPSTIELRITIPRPDSVIINAWAKEEKVPNCKNGAANTSLVKQFLRDFAEMNAKK